MNFLRVSLLAAWLLGGCAGIPRGSDGIAMECDVCRTMWIHLDGSSRLAGDYRIEHQPGRKVCSACETLGRRFVQTGGAPERCNVCGGNLVKGVVELSPDGTG
jgi:hypothetical protein